MVSNTTQQPHPPPSHTLSVYTVLWLWEGGEGWGRWTRQKVRGTIVYRAWSKIPTWLTDIQPINHQQRRHLGLGVFIIHVYILRCNCRCRPWRISRQRRRVIWTPWPWTWRADWSAGRPRPHSTATASSFSTASRLRPIRKIPSYFCRWVNRLFFHHFKI